MARLLKNNFSINHSEKQREARQVYDLQGFCLGAHPDPALAGQALPPKGKATNSQPLLFRNADNNQFLKVLSKEIKPMW